METELPEGFRCPISLEIMSDPVILPSGHTFDRSSIQKWLDSGHRTCPVTQLPLPRHPSLIPNHTLRSLISSFTDKNSQKKQPCPQPQTLITTLSSASTSIDSKLDILHQLARLSKHSSSFRQQLTESGAVSVILRYINSCSDDSILQEPSLALLFNLSLDDQNKVGLIAEGAVKAVLFALINGSSSCRALAATTLTSLALVEVNKVTIGSDPVVIKGLVAMIREGKNREKREAATALYTLCSFAENRKRAVAAGAVPCLFELAKNGVERAVEVLCLLAKCREGREEMCLIDEFTRVLIRILKSGKSRSVIHSLSILNLLCADSKELCLESVNEELVNICVGLLKDDNLKIKKNAAALIYSLQNL